MSDSKTEAKTESGAAGSMSQKDVEFLVACLQNANGGTVSIDSSGVAAALGYDNPRSVQNRISTLKRKYNLPFGSTSGGGKGAAGSSASAASTKAPTTPVKNKVTKTKKEPAAKKTPSKKTAKAPAKSKKVVESDEDAEEEMEDAGGDEEES